LGNFNVTQKIAAWIGDSDPNGLLFAAIGTLFINTTNGVVHRNTDGATTWVPLVKSGGVDLVDGSALPVGAAGTLRLISNDVTKTAQLSLDGTTFVNIVTAP